ncbi:MAG TPA: 50S ribosomal protein L25 [Solirubrobacteraceae bacterium]|jgi:large subunit ribosomal protein L25|nr:50S ribosomal protein L25 [Solirubrobacteraceae bacterium]
MSASVPTRLDVRGREPAGSRSVRRLRREGLVPGILYGGGGDAVSFAVGERDLRHALAARGAVLEVAIDGGRPTPAVLKDHQRDPVRGSTVHLDLVRVRLDQAIQVNVPIELVGAEDAPGVRDGGVLEHVTHEVQVEALPTAIPESIVYDVSGMSIGDTVMLEAIVAPDGVTLLGDPQELVIVTLTPPRLRTEAETELELETEVVGEGAEGASDSDGAEAEEAAAGGESSE